jgi:TolB protein
MNSDGSGKRLLTPGASSPAWSPDGKRIAFVRGANDRADIFVMSAHGTNQHRLTADGVYNNDPAWSPDGKRIAYIRGSLRGDTADNQLVAMNPDGKRKRLLWGTAKQRGPDGRLGAHHPSWSPDGQRIVFYISEQHAIAVVGQNGTGLRFLRNFTGESTWPSWSRK